MKYRSGKSVTGVLPLMIWLSAVGTVVFLYGHRTRTFTVQGLSFAAAQPMASVDNGIVRHLQVQLFQPVQKGDLLAIVEMGSPLQNDYTQALAEARKATALAELDKLRTDLETALAPFEYDYAIKQNQQFMQYRQMILDVEKARLEILQTKALLEPSKMVLFGLELEKNAMQSLLEKNAVESYEFERAKLVFETQASKVAAEENLLEQAMKNFDLVQERLGQYTLAVPDQELIQKILQPYAKAVAVQERRIAELFTPAFRLSLRAPFDGVISEIMCTEGQGFTAGQVLLTVSQPNAEFIMAWVDQNRANTIVPNQPLKVIKQSVPRTIFHSQVVAVSPVVEMLPERLWDNPSMPKWGRPVKIQIPPDAQLAANEVVGVSGI